MIPDDEFVVIALFAHQGGRLHDVRNIKHESIVLPTTAIIPA
jgi:hypothetical protein